MERYSEKYEWTLKFSKVVRDFFQQHQEKEVHNLNMMQEKVL
jgi:hypothetical protein